MFQEIQRIFKAMNLHFDFQIFQIKGTLSLIHTGDASISASVSTTQAKTCMQTQEKVQTSPVLRLRH